MNQSVLPKTKGQARYYFALTRQLQGNLPQSLELIAPLVEQATADGAKNDFSDALVLQADSFFQLEKYDSAMGSTTKYMELFPNGRQIVRALSIQTLAAYRLKDTAQMNAAMGRLIKDFSNHRVTQLTVQQLAELAESNRDWGTAAEYYESLASTQKDPEKRAFALRGVAVSLYRREKFLEASDAFGRIVTEYPNHSLVSECLYYQADSLKLADQIEKSIILFQKLFDSFPADKPAPPESELTPPLEYPFLAGLQVARIYNRANRVQESDAAYEVLLKHFPRPADLDKRLDEWALLNYNSDRFDQADAIWSRLISEVPQSSLVNSARLSLAESDLIAERFERAKEAFEELAISEKSPDDVKERSLFQLVLLALDQQRWDDVRATGSRLTSQFPKSKYRFYVSYSLAESILASAKPSESDLVAVRDQLNQLMQLRVDEINDGISKKWFDRVWVLIAELNFREKKYADVLVTVEDLERRSPNSRFLHQALEVLGRSYKQQAPPKFAEARAAFERVIADPFGARTETAAKAQFLIAETWFHQEKWNDAFLAYHRVYSNFKFPEWQADALLMSGRCDEKQDDWKPAIETYKLLIKEFPNSAIIEEAKSRLAAAQKKLGG